jgi:hypothetical protein
MKNFYLTVYAYHLRLTLSNALNEFKKDASYLWESLIDLGNSSLPFDGLKDLKSNLLPYENSNLELEGLLTKNQTILDLGTIPTEIDFQIEGKLAPFLLNDTYAIDLTLWAESPEKTEIDVSQLKYFNPQGSLLKLNPSLGKTIWIYAEVEDDDDTCQIIAKNCVQELLSDTQFTSELVNVYYRSFYDKLFDSLLFEFKVTNLPQSDNSATPVNILVSLNNSQNSSLYKFAETSKYLLDLLCSYHKINYVNKQAKQLYPEIRKLYNKLENKIHNVDLPRITANKDTEVQLEELKQLLADTLPISLEYSQKFRALQVQLTAIKTNITNYKNSVDNIADIDNHTPMLWQTFSKRSCEHWQQQIQTDIEYFAPGQDLFKRVTDAISGFLQIKQAEYERASRNLLRKAEEEQQKRDQEQKKRDRKLENTIQSLGIGIAVGSSAGGILASTYQVSPNFAKNILQIKSKDGEATFPENTQILGFSFGTSIVIGVAFGLASMWFTKWILDILDRRELRKQEQEQISG